MGAAESKEDTTAATWGEGLSQEELMIRDTVLVLNENDEVTGSASKKDSHVFNAEQPRGILHRAFSVFLLDASQQTLLLHQRAADKITFPNVWTNTCCSHPLHGMQPNEVDAPSDVASGSVPGVKHAAIRKLIHELGIPPQQLQPLQQAILEQQQKDDSNSTSTSTSTLTSVEIKSADGKTVLGTMQLKFLTRLHYWAADTATHGPGSPWGEHEIDYCLFLTVSRADLLTLKPHPEEIQAVRWVSLQDLSHMLAQPDQYSFSPWFRILHEQWLTAWWKDLPATMSTDRYEDFDTIHRFDPPASFMGGAGNAGPLFPAQTKQRQAVMHDASKKQGAYGKIPTHKEPIWQQLMHVDEIFAAVTLLYLKPLQSNVKSPYILKQFCNKNLNQELEFCVDMLTKVSRSFAAVILQLPDVLLVDILVFYLVLRALDTVEDDMTAFGGSHAVKIKHLQHFHNTALVQPDWSMQNVGQGDERVLLEQFPKCQKVFLALSQASQQVISDITQRMANGMAKFVSKDLGQGTVNVEEYNRYCHFVAGLVGEGLSRLFAVSGLEDPSFAKETNLSNQMGLFLQKTNIIRDYLEDYVDQRAFWPQSIWKKYTPSDVNDLGWFANRSSNGNNDHPQETPVKKEALHCLNELVTDALELVPDCLTYLSKLQCAEIFKFCAIPQVMAIATLDKLYHNPNVFTGVVKIRKGLSCQLIVQCESLDQVHATFYTFASRIRAKVLANHHQDPNAERTLAACQAILDWTQPAATQNLRRSRLQKVVAAAAVAATSFMTVMGGRQSVQQGWWSSSSVVWFTGAAVVVGCLWLAPASTNRAVLRPASAIMCRPGTPTPEAKKVL